MIPIAELEYPVPDVRVRAIAFTVCTNAHRDVVEARGWPCPKHVEEAARSEQEFAAQDAAYRAIDAVTEQLATGEPPTEAPPAPVARHRDDTRPVRHLPKTVERILTRAGAL